MIVPKMEKSILIKAPPEKVWEMLALDRQPEWLDMMESVDYTSKVNTIENKYQVGLKVLGTPKGGPPGNCHYEILESVEYKKFKHLLWEKWLGKKLGGPVTYLMESVEDGTKLTVTIEMEMPWGILLKIIEPIIVRMGKKEYEKSLNNLKNILEK